MTGAVVTGAGRGIGAAIAGRLAREGWQVAVNDLDAGALTAVADRIGAVPLPGDCATSEGVAALVEAATAELGHIDAFFANAGIDTGAGLGTDDATWARVLEVNLMAHVRAARALLPGWLADGRGGRFVVTASAAGLLTMLGNAPYSVSKHAAVGFAEWLSATYSDRGVVVQVLCPQGVRTRMLDDVGALEPLLVASGALEPDEVADALWNALQDNRFLVLPHPEVAGFYRHRAGDTDRWLGAMNGLQVTLGVPRFEGLMSLPGLDLEALTGWLDGAAPGLRTGPLQAVLITGGLSNLTFRVTDGERRWALRRPPVAHTLPTAHDMAREYRVISALRPTAVPVPSPVLLCQDAGVLGAPFYLMSFVDGVVLDRPEALAALTPEVAWRACEQLVDTLLELHSLDPVELGLADFGRPDGFLDRQLRRWTAQWGASQTEPDGDQVRLAEAVATALGRHLPAQSAPGLVHGDYRLTNLIYTPQVTAIAAVVDWELTTLGDPLADLGLLTVYQNLALTGDFVMPRTPGSAGFMTSEQIVQRYAASSARNLAALDWYVAFGYFKLAVIAQGVHYRHVHGGSVDLGPGYADAGRWVGVLLAEAERRFR